MNNSQFNNGNNNSSFNFQSLNNQNNNGTYVNSNQISNNNFQTTNTINQENINSSSTYNSKKGNIKNKKNILLIFVVVMLVVAVVVTGMNFFGRDAIKNNGNNFGNNGNNILDSDEIIQIYIDGYGTKGNEQPTVVALSKNNKLYAIGQNSYGWGGKGALKKVTLLADNVSSFEGNGDLYVDGNGNINISGISIKGGTYDQYENIGGNVKKISGQWSGILALGNDGNLYSYGTKEYNGFGTRYDELTKIEGIDNVIDIYMDFEFLSYINSSNELYAKRTMGSGEFEKVLDNVKSVNGCAVQTTDNKIYDISYDYDQSKVVALLQEDVISVINTSGGPYYKTEDKIRHIDGYQRELTFGESYNYHYPKDVKEMLYMQEFSEGTYYPRLGIKYIYLDNNNKINLYEVKYNDGDYKNIADENKKTLNYSIDNMKKIYDFMFAK